MIMYLQQIFTNFKKGVDMRVGPIGRCLRGLLLLIAVSMLPSAGLVANAFAAEAQKADSGPPPSKESFNLILPFKDLTVGQGQEATMDAEVVNRTKDPVEVTLTIESIPKGWDVNFNSRYPSFPVRSVTVQGGDQNSNKSTTLEFKTKIPENTKPGVYPIKVTAKDTKGNTQYAETINYRVTSKKIDTGGIKLTSQYPVLSTGSGQTLKFTRRSQERNQQAAANFIGCAGAPRLDGALQTAVWRPTDIVDSIEREWLGDFERGGGHAGDCGCERVSGRDPGSRRRI